MIAKAISWNKLTLELELAAPFVPEPELVFMSDQVCELAKMTVPVGILLELDNLELDPALDYPHPAEQFQPMSTGNVIPSYIQTTLPPWVPSNTTLLHLCWFHPVLNRLHLCWFHLALSLLR